LQVRFLFFQFIDLVLDLGVFTSLQMIRAFKFTASPVGGKEILS